LDQKSEVVITALAHKQTITLPDSSVVQLNTGGTIRYKERSWKGTRSVTLNGEAFFDVRKNNVPFIVHTGFSNTKVMGTSFNISAIADSVQVACFSGKVAITNTQLNTPIVYLTAGWGSTVKKAYAPSAPAPIDSNLISWSTGILSFQATPLNQVIAQLTKHYGVRIYLKNKGLRTFTGIFDQKSLKEIIEIICLANNLSFSGSSQEGYIIF
jgi:ferric-dicitrate binding protein FerR (iron transport regulator)